MKTVTREHLAEAAWNASPSGVSRREAREMLDETLALMAQALVDGEPVKIGRFANFRTRRKPQRMGRNPKRPDQQAVIEPRTVVLCKFMPELKETVATGLEPIPPAGENWFRRAKVKA